MTLLTSTPERLRRSLDRLRSGGAPIAVEQLAREILALQAPVERSVARRVVATALGLTETSLHDELAARHLRPAEEIAVSDRRLAQADFVVVDLETTGLSPQTATILEIGAVRVRALDVAGKFETLIRPHAPLSRAIADLTGIDDAMLADAPDARFALRGFRAWFDRIGPAPFVAHSQPSPHARLVAGGLACAGVPRTVPPTATWVMAPLESDTHALPSSVANTTALGLPGSFVVPTCLPESPMNCPSALEPDSATHRAAKPAVRGCETR